MLVREIARRYLGEGKTILLDADPDHVKDLDRIGRLAELTPQTDPAAGDVVVCEVDAAAADLADRLGRVREPGAVVLLLLAVPVAELPIGRLAQAAAAAGLAFVELAPVEPGWAVRVVVVCRPSRKPVAVRAYLGDEGPPEDVDLDAQGVRMAWEWGLGDARRRAVEQQADQQLDELHELRAQLSDLQRRLERGERDVAEARAETARVQRWAEAEAQRRAVLQQSPTYLVGRAVLTARRHPVKGARQLVGAIRRGARARRGLG